ncbi:Uncharacterized protein conserved in bacteria [Bordetella ansorpii]|uniref:Uncharacterized protein conserved in bacteria n=1 Tax=Bordetella ansorpii TaxID=288768 RepID=A0A157SAZ1_9BORD|nr:DUF934 domain-containing protein [Bordetella ansorpii]SAI67610.1 Uncharacterized protein conserved in bacteria [Bordetella ansorpii]
MPDATLDLSTAHLIHHGALQADTWRNYVPEDGAAADAVPADEPGWVVPLATWKAARDVLRARQHPVGVLLPPDTDLTDLLGGDGGTLDTTGIALIAIEFPAYTDGRGYSLAQLLRTRYGYTGELRAVGDVMIDTIHYQARVGFDSFLVKPGHDPHKALAAFKTFSVHYQKTYRAPAA